MLYPTQADVFRPSSIIPATLYDLALIGGGSMLIALSAQVAIRLPFSPVPVTAQTFAVLLIAALLGKKRAVAAVLAYLAQGVAGLPVFSGGLSGPAAFLGPTGGYLWGFLAAAPVVGQLAEHGWDHHPVTAAAAMLMGNAIIYSFGLFWLLHVVGAEQVLAMGLIPFIPGDLLKIVLATAALPAGWKLISRE